MPYPNYHACRLKEPSEFREEGYSYGSRTSGGKKYHIIFGRLRESGKSREQAYRYAKSVWDASEAKKHCTKHGGILFEKATGGNMKQADIVSAAVSHEELREKLYKAVKNRFGNELWVEETWDDHVILRDYEKYWKAPYKKDKDGQIVFSEDKTEVKKVFQQVVDLPDETVALLMAQRHPGHPAWSSVNKSELPKGAFLIVSDPEKKSTWKLPYKYKQTDGALVIHPGGVLAMWQAINGSRSGKAMDISSSLRAKAKALYERYWGKKGNAG